MFSIDGCLQSAQGRRGEGKLNFLMFSIDGCLQSAQGRRDEGKLNFLMFSIDGCINDCWREKEANLRSKEETCISLGTRFLLIENLYFTISQNLKTCYSYIHQLRRKQETGVI
jgi:hypothetical protein